MTHVADSADDFRRSLVGRLHEYVTPDGTTLMVATQTTYAVAPQLYKSVAFDAPRDVAGVALLGASPLVLVVNPSFPAKSIGELNSFSSMPASA